MLEGLKLYRVRLMLTQKYVKYYWVLAGSSGIAKALSETQFRKKNRGILYAPEIVASQIIKELEIKPGVLDV